LASLLVSAVAIVAAAGCGGSSDGDSAKAQAQASTSKTEFIKRSNAFCSASRNDIRRRFIAYRRHLPNPATPLPKVYAGAASEFIMPSLQFWYDDILSLTPPPGDEAEIEDILRTVEITVANIMDLEIHSGRKLSALFNRSNRLMRQYGIDSCIVTRNFAYG